MQTSSNRDTWRSTVLGDVTREVSHRIGKNVPQLRIYGVERGTGLTPTPKYVAKDISRYKKIEQGMFAYNPMRLNIGSIGYCSTSHEPGAVSPDYVVFECESSSLDSRFMHYLTQSQQWDEWVRGAGVGSVRVRIYYRELARMELRIPALDEQRNIASVLSSLDDKVEQNRRTVAKLEELARAVFKAWFVDFEPVKAKAAGATAFPGMPPDTFATLPTRFVDSELGPVPKGWERCIRRISELEREGTLLIGDGYRAKRSELADTGVPFIRAGNVDGMIITEGAELLGEPAIAKAGVKRSQLWDTVFTSKGTVGRIGVVAPATGDVVYAPQVCFWRALDPTKLSQFLLHLWMKSDAFTHQWMSVKGQTDMADFVSLSDQRAMTILVPPPEFQQVLDTMVRPVVERVAASTAESAKLASLRDDLLPRLLSGRVRVNSV
ncbi:MAG: restriction endonuclease subunit S [Planctomycetaceae bacterium]